MEPKAKMEAAGHRDDELDTPHKNFLSAIIWRAVIDALSDKGIGAKIERIETSYAKRWLRLPPYQNYRSKEIVSFKFCCEACGLEPKEIQK